MSLSSNASPAHLALFALSAAGITGPPEAQGHTPSSDPTTALRGTLKDIQGTPHGELDRFISGQEPSEKLLRSIGVYSHLLARTHTNWRRDTGDPPPAITLQDILNSDRIEHYKKDGVEIVLTDVDGTTYGGFFSADWALCEVVQHGPRRTMGLPWTTLVYALNAVLLRIQEKIGGRPDPALFHNTFKRVLPGFDKRLLEESFERYHQNFGGRRINQFMQGELVDHRRAGRLILGVSASPEYLVRLHGRDHLGLPSENMFGTILETDERGLGTGGIKWLHGETKVDYIREKVLNVLDQNGIPWRIYSSSSDSQTDKPLLDLAREGRQNGPGMVFGIDPSPELRRIIASKGGVVVDEGIGWYSPGETEVTLFAPSIDGVSKLFAFTQGTEPEFPHWIRDLGGHALRVFPDGLGISGGAAFARYFETGGLGFFPKDLLPGAAALLTSLLTSLPVPTSGPPPSMQKRALRGVLPLLPATIMTGLMNHYSPSSLAAFVLASTIALAVNDRWLWRRSP